MAKVFISHSSEDKYFVNLLVALLDFHYIETWCSLTNLHPGTKFPGEIENALKTSDYMLVVVSENSIKSKWITKEISVFETRKPGSLVIPLLLESVDLDEVVPGLSDYQSIDFMKCMLTGFKELLQLFGKEFLPRSERRSGEKRRDGENRRKSENRRSTNLTQRMRLGFWKSYSSACGIGKFDDLWLSVRERFKVIDYLKYAANEYVYLDETKNKCDIDDVLEKATNIVWEELRKKDEFVKVIYVIEAVAEEIKRNYIVKPIERRTKSGRRSVVDRRDDDKL
ncbi:MAG: toll/interleukin-1 receptor domain-containing protein [Candidatus Aminicenantes bacterium]|nr:toll/interleukin-1 receptor domain-containing protein [Candidatus Aminicenantes bacterium]